jgi:hypothetical protein
VTASWLENMQIPGTVLMASRVFLCSLGGCDGDGIVWRKFALLCNRDRAEEIVRPGAQDVTDRVEAAFGDA